MSRSLTFVMFAACALASALLFPSTSHAQRPLWGEDAMRRCCCQPPSSITVACRLSSALWLSAGSGISLWGNYARNFWNVYEIDLQERFEAFGTRYGPDRPPLLNRLLHRPHY